MSKPLVLAALVFQIIGLVWDFVYHLSNGGLGEFFAQAHWPIFLGFVLLLVAVLQAFPKKSAKSARLPDGQGSASGGKDPTNLPPPQ